MAKLLAISPPRIWIGDADPGASETLISQGDTWYTPSTGNLFFCADPASGFQVWLKQTQNYYLRVGSGTIGGGGSVGITYSTAFPNATDSIQITYTGAAGGTLSPAYDTVSASGATVYGDAGATFSYVAFGT